MAPTSKPGAKSNASKRKQSTEDSPISPVRAVQNKKARTSAAASVDNTKGDAKKDPKVQPLQEKKAVVIDLEGSDSEDDEDDENKHDDGGTFSPEIRARLNYIEEHTADLTDTYLRFILNELDGYMGPRGGGNSFVVASIVQHCGSQAQLGRTNLRLEKRAVRDAYVQCYGTCGDDEEEDDDFYDVPEEVLERVKICMDMLDELPEEKLIEVMKVIPDYKGSFSGDDLVENIINHLDERAAHRHDISVEEELIRKITETVG